MDKIYKAALTYIWNIITISLAVKYKCRTSENRDGLHLKKLGYLNNGFSSNLQNGNNIGNGLLKYIRIHNVNRSRSFELFNFPMMIDLVWILSIL